MRFFDRSTVTSVVSVTLVALGIALAAWFAPRGSRPSDQKPTSSPSRIARHTEHSSDRGTCTSIGQREFPGAARVVNGIQQRFDVAVSDRHCANLPESQNDAAMGLSRVAPTVDTNVRLVGFQDLWPEPQPETEEEARATAPIATAFDGGPVKFYAGVDQSVRDRLGREPTWNDSSCIPWEEFGYGEYVGPFRTPHVPNYRIRVNDQLQFIYYLTRERLPDAYRLYVGDIIQITSAIDPTLDQQNIQIISDGKISLRLIGQVMAAGKTVEELQQELNKQYAQYIKNPSIVVQVTQSDTPLADLLNAVDARFGQGGQTQQVQVSPDGTLQLPLIGAVPAVGLSLEEIRREVNARYRSHMEGVEVTPRLVQRAPRFVYVVGQVANPGRYELTGPTSAIQSIALAGGFLQGGNLRNVVVLRRDDQWRLMATRLDLAGGLYGQRPYPSDEIWLRDSDIVLVPPKPIQRLSEAVDLYLTRTLYSIIPEQILFNFDSGSSL